jgi:hypothetical protein
MRRGLVTLLAAAIVGAMLAQAPAAGRPPALAATARHSVRLNVALPGPDSSGIALLTVKTRAGKDPRGSITVGSLSQDRLPSGIRAIAIVTPRTSHKRRATFTVYVAISNLSPRATTDAHTGALPPHMEIVLTDLLGQETSVTFTGDLTFPKDCGALNRLGSLADSEPGFVELYALAMEQSHPEEILDHLAYDRFKCPGAETPELGAT